MCSTISCSGFVRRAGGRESWRGSADERPASRVLDAEERRAAAPFAFRQRFAPIGRREQCAQSGEAVGVHEPQHDQLGERILDLRAQHARRLDDLVVEAGAVSPPDSRRRLGRARTHRRGLRRRRHRAIPQPEIAPRQQRDRRRADRAGVSRGDTRRCGEARPHGASGETQIVEPGEVVVVEPRRQDLGFPRRRGRLEALELRDQRRQRVGTFAPLAGNDVLPATEKAHEILRRDRLDLLPQPLDGIAMDAREQRPVAPLGLRSRRA